MKLPKVEFTAHVNSQNVYVWSAVAQLAEGRTDD